MLHAPLKKVLAVVELLVKPDDDFDVPFLELVEDVVKGDSQLGRDRARTASPFALSRDIGWFDRRCERDKARRDPVVVAIFDLRSGMSLE